MLLNIPIAWLSQNEYGYFPSDVHLDCFQLFTLTKKPKHYNE